jgi:hypothetical protein
LKRYKYWEELPEVPIDYIKMKHGFGNFAPNALLGLTFGVLATPFISRSLYRHYDNVISRKKGFVAAFSFYMFTYAVSCAFATRN